MKKIYKKVIACAVALSTLHVTAFSAPWYEEAVKHSQEKEIISEDYDINGMLTRGEMAEMLGAAAELSAYYIDNPFSDLKEEDSWTDDIIRLYNAGIYMGSEEEGKLNANADEVLTKEQAAAFIVRTYGLENEDIDTVELTFTDTNEISDYSVNDIKIVVKLGIVAGYDDGSFKPKNEIAKTEFITMLYKADSVSEGNKPDVSEKSAVTDDKLSENIVIENISADDITAENEMRLRFTRLSEEPGALYVYNPQDFQLEKKVNGVWIAVSRDKGEINDIGYQIKADSSSERTINLSDFYENLEAGEYRLVYRFQVNGVGIEKGIKYGAVEFKIADTEFNSEESK